MLKKIERDIFTGGGNNLMWESQYESNYLAHHGILGMKWGVRRYQNEDGSLTPAGRLRYNQDSEGNLTRKTKEETRKEKDLQKRQAEWDKNVSENSYMAYNKAVDIVNAKLDKWSDDYANKHGGTNAFYTAGDQREWEKVALPLLDKEYTKALNEMFGKRPE